MLKKVGTAALRYGIALGAFGLILLISLAVPRLLGFNLDLTWLIILILIACSWYLGLGPGLLIAVALEATLIYFSTAPYNPKATINRLILFTSVAWFASSRRRAENSLRDQREWLSVTLQSIGDAVIATDVNGKIQFINPAAEALTGWTKSETENKRLEEVFRVINEESRETVESPFTRVMREGNVVGLANHTVLITKDNREIPIEDSGAPIKDAKGKIIGVILVFHDVAEQRRSELEREQLLKREQHARREAEEANRLKDEFLATVSHELRTPLNAILGWASVLNNGKYEEKTVKTALSVIERNAKAQAEIIGDILDVSRIITGNLNLKSEAVSLVEIINSAIETSQPAANAKNIKLIFDSEFFSPAVKGDTARLQQIVWNLISNAIKFTQNGGRVEIQLNRLDAHVEIKVIDDGIGIEAEFLPRVFERFTQADSSTTRAYSGLGLGLSIVRHLVELHGGTVSAESEGKNQGSTFIVRLPIAASEKQVFQWGETISDDLSEHNQIGIQ